MPADEITRRPALHYRRKSDVVRVRTFMPQCGADLLTAYFQHLLLDVAG